MLIYDNVYIDSVTLLKALANAKRDVQSDSGFNTILIEECLRIIKIIDKMPRHPTVHFPSDIRQGLMNGYKWLLLNGNANLE